MLDDNVSGISATIFGATGTLGYHVGSELGRIGSDLLYPTRQPPYIKNVHRSDFYKMLKLSGQFGSVFTVETTDFRDPGEIMRMVKHANVVINLIGPLRWYRKPSFFDECNIEIPR